MVAEVARAVAGMRGSEAILNRYESKPPNPPLGKLMHEGWDVERRRPTKKYTAVAKRFKREMLDLGPEPKVDRRLSVGHYGLSGGVIVQQSLLHGH